METTIYLQYVYFQYILHIIPFLSHYSILHTFLMVFSPYKSSIFGHTHVWNPPRRIPWCFTPPPPPPPPPPPQPQARRGQLQRAQPLGDPWSTAHPALEDHPRNDPTYPLANSQKTDGKNHHFLLGYINYKWAIFHS